MIKRTRIGVVIPATNATCEPDFNKLAPEGVTVHAQRLPISKGGGLADSSGDGIQAMNDNIESTVEVLACAGIDIIAYACTTGSFFLGPGWDEEMLRKMSSAGGGIPAVGTSPAVITAFKALGAKRVSVTTPYTDWINQRLRKYLESKDIEVLNLDAMVAETDEGITRDEPAEIADFAVKHCHPDADAIMCSCTSWRALEAASEIETRSGKPVITSNQATIWETFGRLGIAEPVTGYGRLLETPWRQALAV